MEYGTGPPTAVIVNVPVYGPPRADCVNLITVGDTLRVPGDGVGDGRAVWDGDGGADVLDGGAAEVEVAGGVLTPGAEVCAAGTALGGAVIVTVIVGLADLWRWR